MEGCFLRTEPSSLFGESGNGDGIVTHSRGKDVLHKTGNLSFTGGANPSAPLNGISITHEMHIVHVAEGILHDDSGETSGQSKKDGKRKTTDQREHEGR